MSDRSDKQLSIEQANCLARGRVRVSAEMVRLLDALHSVMGQLALVEMTTRKLFDEPARRCVPPASEPVLTAGHRPKLQG